MSFRFLINLDFLFLISFLLHILWIFSSLVCSPFIHKLQLYEQVRCFDAPLQPSEIAGVKTVVQQKVPEGVNSHGLTFPGFIYVHSMFLRKGRPETLWAVLRNYGYDNDLKLRDDFLPVPSKNASDQVILSILVLSLWKFHYRLSVWFKWKRLE